MDIFVNNANQLNKIAAQAQGIDPHTNVSFPLVTSQAQVPLADGIMWNQLIRFNAGWAVIRGTAVETDNIIHVTATQPNVQIYTVSAAPANHVYLVTSHVKAYQNTSSTYMFIYSTNEQVNTPYYQLQTNEWTLVEGLLKPTYASSRVYVRFDANGAVGDTYDVKREIMRIDITEMFGAVIADYVYNLETSTPGAGLEWIHSLFPAEYYEYDAGTLKPFNQTLFFNI